MGVRDDGVTDLGECKWGPVRSANALRRELAAKAEHYPNPRDRTLRLNGFTHHPMTATEPRGDDDIAWHELKDLYV